MNRNNIIKTRVAPSPTGFLHIGTARTALFNYLFAKKNNGKFVLRIDDTDKERSKKEFEKDIIKGLEWLNLKHDEFYRQSERAEIYKKYINQLLENGSAFYCYHTKEELEKEKQQQMENKEAPRHICSHKDNPPEGTKKEDAIIKLRGTSEMIKFNDLVRGEIECSGDVFGDISIAKNEDTPLYNLVSVIDDHEMNITHIIRGEDHISNTPKQILIQKALDIPRPEYAHMPLALGSDRSKLSKRHGATSLNTFKEQGYLPEAMINFMALLGWNPGDNREIFSLQDLIKEFSIEKIQKGGAIFNIDKLDWFNKEHIKLSDTGKLAEKLLNYLPKKLQEKAHRNKKLWLKIVELEKERLAKLTDIGEGIDFFFGKPKYKKNIILWKEETPETTAKNLHKIIELISDLNEEMFTAEEIKSAVWDYAEKKGRGNVLWPFRVSLTGLEKSPDPFSVAEVLGKEETMERIRKGIKKLA